MEAKQQERSGIGHLNIRNMIACISYMKYTNIGSYSTAIANGMKKIKEYSDEKNEISYAYAITRKEWSASG